jgi:hypothetical protein
MHGCAANAHHHCSSSSHARRQPRHGAPHGGEGAATRGAPHPTHRAHSARCSRSARRRAMTCHGCGVALPNAHWQWCIPCNKERRRQHGYRVRWHTCVQCGIAFSNHHYHGRRCLPCRQLSRPPKPQPALICRSCGGPRDKGQRYCVTCAQQLRATAGARRRAYELAYNHSRRGRGLADHTPTTRACLSCGAPITSPRYRRRIYCNRRCYKRFRKIRATMIGGTGLRMSDLPSELLELVRLYRQAHKELQRQWQPGLWKTTEPHSPRTSSD